MNWYIIPVAGINARYFCVDLSSEREVGQILSFRQVCPEIVGKSGEVCGCGVVCPEMLSKSGEFH